MQKFNDDIINNLWGKEWFQFIKENPDKPWNFALLSRNPTITWDIVEDNPDKLWDFQGLSDNKMPAAKAKYIEHLTQSVDIISDWFLDLKTDPDSKLCQKWMTRVQSEYYKTDPWQQQSVLPKTRINL